jgi:hypothetical protein
VIEEAIILETYLIIIVVVVVISVALQSSVDLGLSSVLLHSCRSCVLTLANLG